MIIGVILRNFKTYTNINYIPLTYEQNFCGLVGDNGIGKSSVLEALECFFNNKPWNYNVVTKKRGIAGARPHIVPVFMLEINAEVLSMEQYSFAKKISDYIWELDEIDILSQNRDQFKTFSDQLNLIRRRKNKNSTLILPIGYSYDNVPNMSIFNTKKMGEIFFNDFDKTMQQVQDEQMKIFEPLLFELKGLFEYIYIPKDIDPDSFTQLETKEIQSLMGETLTEIVEKCVPQEKIQEINNSLSSFIDTLSIILEDYSFRTGGERQVNLRKHDVYKLIVEAYFNIRKLHKKEGQNWLEMSVLSSGEKQKAIIDLAYHFLKSYRNETQSLILAIDEPESSLHMSACFDQFSKLYEVSSLCKQLIFTTHWYGFIPTVQDGCVNIISKNEKSHLFELIEISCYRETVKQTLAATKGKLPYDIRLKSINDFTQSIVTSILKSDPYNWLICEGSSERLYFEKYFEDIKISKKLRIIPVGGAKEIKRIYNNLQVAYEDFKNDIQGKVVLITDTDSELVQYSTKSELENLICLRLVNNEKDRKTILVKIDSNSVSPKTEIEDALNGKLFIETLNDFKDQYPGLDNLLKNVEDCTEESTYFSLDISPNKQKILDDFFNRDNNKYTFATRYVEKLTNNHLVPEWIESIKRLY